MNGSKVKTFLDSKWGKVVKIILIIIVPLFILLIIFLLFKRLAGKADVRKKARAEKIEAKADRIETKTENKDNKADARTLRKIFRACKKGCRSVPRKNKQRRNCKKTCGDTYRAALQKLGAQVSADDQNEINDVDS